MLKRWGGDLRGSIRDTFDSLIEAASFVQTLEQRQGMKICCPEEIAYRMGFITHAQLVELSGSHGKSGYGDYLMQIAETGAV